MSGAEVALIGVLGTIAAAVFGFMGAKLVRRSAREANQTTNWEKMFEANEKQMARMQTDLDNLWRRVGKMETALTESESDNRGLLDYVRLFLRWADTYVPDLRPPAPPERIREKL